MAYTDQQLLDRVLRRLSLTSADTANAALVVDMLEDAENAILTYTGQSTVPDALQTVQCELAVMSFNARGIEGHTSHSEGSVSVSIDMLPVTVQKQINQYRVAKIVDMLTAPVVAT